MKKVCLFFLLALMTTGLQAQGPGPESTRNHPRFHAGVSYSYLHTWYKVTDFSAHSVWQGMDLGTLTLDKEELDVLNDQEKNSTGLNNLMITAGAVLLDKPESKWYIDGSLLFGLSAVKSETDPDLPVQNEMVVKSGLANPMAGINFNLRYNITKNWGVSLIPEFMVFWGRSKDITDSIHPMVPHFDNNLKEDYTFLYSRITPMGTFMVKHLTVSAGPGFYYAYAKRRYLMDRTDPETGKEYYDEIKTSLCSKSLIDGCLKVDWTIIDPLTFSVEAAVGNDLYLNAGLRYNF